ncbi:hypothetical protein IV54_GL000186 [Levilactobacillus paucivorans]|uniref:Uncharacterized protein n=1 Tax=Levilactobacillus paucivorans TaxID=616990 RepID=A0A0R2LNZ8_9LACO|nr:PTS lactose/cellobiose transporter subunit IIA [Levilactobacillus paucivorans]KRO03461.1 hypothetical protein IV54_GL000186 [Levilactobacillus paucivorans]
MTATTVTQLAMQLLLAAGEAKQLLLKAAADGKLTPTELAPCRAKLVTAHQVQTKIMAELTSKGLGPDILVIHAMDSLMTVESNFELIQLLNLK